MRWLSISRHFPRSPVALATIGIGLSSLHGGDHFPFRQAIEEAEPVQHWGFDSVPDAKNVSAASGPSVAEFPDFGEENGAARFKNGGRLTIPDLGEDSIYDFDNGDEITVEAMVSLDSLRDQAAILTKGRTNNPKAAKDNQNWAFRLKKTKDGTAGVNFLFHSRQSEHGNGDWHRWTSLEGFGVGSGWHHVAISYRFGDPDSIRGYINGKPVEGRWDMGGPTKAPPVVDDDEVWIGSSMGGSLGNSLFGAVDEIALYRKVLPPSAFSKRSYRRPPKMILPEPKPGVVEFTLHPWEDHTKLPLNPATALTRWEQNAMGFIRLPHRYDDWGVRADWGVGAMVRAVTEIELEPGQYEFLGRSRGVARLIVDGETLLKFPTAKRGGGAHNKVAPVPEVPREGMRPHALDDVERLASFASPGGKHTIIFDVMVGGPKLRLEFGEGSLAIANEGGMFHLVGANAGPPLTDQGWAQFVDETNQVLDARDRRVRREADTQADYWKQRHALAAKQLVSRSSTDQSIDQLVAQRIDREREDSGDPDSYFNRKVRPLFAEHCYRCHGEKEKGGLNLQVQENLFAGGDSELPAVVAGEPDNSHLLFVVGPDSGGEQMPPKGDGLTEKEISILHEWVKQGGKLDAEPRKIQPSPPLVDDLVFLRRAWIDTLGVAPDLETIRAFMSDTSPDKRARMIDRLLKDDRWADNWMGYWQDVLAENPNLLKPNLNNTGPFRFWIHEALLDNKPLDRFATELIAMRGSTWDGGTAGFGIASQNDVPMAAKAHILTTAFLGVDLKCARCHDSPYHGTTQQDLFEIAAMLDRNWITIPETSSVPAAFFEHVEKGGRESLIEVSLKVGATVGPSWPFEELSASVPEDLLQNPKDTRELAAAEITFSRRFAEVMTNRIWKRFMGAGLVESVDDWEGKQPSDPELLAYLSDEFIRSGYDAKELARQIMNSQLYQREAIDPPANLAESERFFEGPYRRRMTAEQVVDNAWSAAGRTMDVGLLTMDMEGRLRPGFFMNFGSPQRAWQFTTLANERDRPSLAMPKIQAVVDVLLAFGWRNSRQEPTSYRIEEPNPLQPGILSNGVMGSWLTRLTDDSLITRMCLEAESPEQLTDDLFLRFLTRLPTEREKNQFVSLLADGFEYRIVPETEIGPPAEEKRYPYVSWMNHLDSEANTIKQEQEKEARQGPPPTRYLKATWRESAEDALWALMNSPEMILIP